MLRLAKAIFGTRQRRTDRSLNRIVEAAIDKTVDGTDPRLRAVRAYKSKLRDSVTTAVAYVSESVDAMASPLPVSRRAYGSDPQVNGFFGSVGDMQRIFSTSPVVREFEAGPDAVHTETFYAGLAMTMEEKRVFVPSRKGDVVQMEVPRISVNFSGHRIAAALATEAALRMELKDRVFMALVERALDRLTSIMTQKDELKQRRRLLQRKLKTLEKRGLGMESFIASNPAPFIDTVSVDQELLAVEAQLNETAASVQTLDDYLVQVADVMNHPDQHVRINPGATRVTRMALKATADSGEPSAEVHYTEFEIVDRRVVGRLVSFPRGELLPLEHFKPRIWG